MAGINIGRLEVRMSGGASNTVGNSSLGGAMSTVAGGLIDSQTGTGISNITGVVVEDSMGNSTAGTGTLTFNATPAVAQVQTLTTDADVITDNVYNTTVDGIIIATPFNSNNDQTLLDHANAIAAEPGVSTATVTDSGSNDRVINITAQTAGTAVVLTSFNITGGASQAGVTRGVTTGNKPLDSLMWQDNGAGENDAVDVSSDGVYAIPSIQGGNLVVTVTSASLPVANQTDTITIADIANELFDDIDKAESFSGDTEYRCFYFDNSDSTDTFFGVKLWISLDANPDDLAIGLDPAGLNGTATTIGGEGTAPAGVSFSSPTTEGTGLSLGDMAAGDNYAVWIRRTIVAGNQVANSNDLSALSFSASF